MKKLAILFVTVLFLLIVNCSSESNNPVDNREDPSTTDPIITDTAGIMTNEYGMELKLILSGTFTMGSNATYADFEGERPAHSVTITSNYYMGVTEVTQSQYQTLIGSNPSSNVGDNLPVVNVTWNDAAAFCERLSTQTGHVYRLPTDAEWEYAGRAGTTGRFFWGDDESLAGDYCWYESNSGGRIYDVKTKSPNAWGLYDMAGNVEEWVSDLYNMMSSSSQTDPQGPGQDAWGGTTNHVLRGGNMRSSPRFLHSCWRHGHEGGAGSRGFRVVMEVVH